ncbi:MAG: hypothetical protein ACI8PZ_006337 [Myxococcota bacterium]|jgi:hypothetical protein
MWRASAWWAALPDVERARWTAVSWLVAVYLVGYILLIGWYIEDAAITFSYAKHAALGEGFVAYPGGERVEGFSNPSWTLLLTALCAVGITPWVSAKLLGALLGAVTLVWTARIGRLWFGAAGGLWPVLPAALLAVDPQLIIWNASGLENSLVVAMLAAGTLVAMDDEAPAWHAVALGVLAMTRPEAPLYAAVLAGVGILRITSHNGPIAGLRWAVTRGAVALAPWLAWEAFSYAYFAWPFPNTYYAKLDDGEVFDPWAWGGGGWVYLRKWSLERGMVVILPLLVVGQTGLAGWRRWLGLGIGALSWLLLLPGLGVLADHFTEPAVLSYVRIAWLFALAGFLPFVSLERSHATSRALAWWLLVSAGVFTLVANGDWMLGHRWLSFGALPLALLVADAGREVWLTVPEAWRRSSAIAALCLPAGWGIVDYIGFLNNAETTPWDISRRVTYVQGIEDRLQLDHASLLDVDFGGTMWWSGDELIDLAGLNDVSIAQHAWEPEFFGEYLYEERQPTFMHAHGSWATRTGVRDHPGWRKYIEVPGYPSSRRRFHVGNHIRRDLVEWQEFAGEHRAQFERGLQVSWSLGAPVTAPGEALQIELGWHTRRRPALPFRAVLVLQDETRTLSWEIPPAYDWIAPPVWTTRDHYVSRHALTLPANLAVGQYDLAIVVFDEASGAVRAADGTPDAPDYAAGEARWVDAVELVTPDAARAHADSMVSVATTRSEAGDCELAEEALLESRRTRHAERWSPHTDPEMRRALARCWAWGAESAEREVAVDAIVKARRWDHREAEVQRVGIALADAWVDEGDLALSRDDLERAHDAWTDALRADPTRAWLRKKVEAWRDVRLGLTDERPGEISLFGGGS